MKKKVLSIFLALMLCLSLLPTAALAEEAGTAGAGDTLAAEQGEGNTVAGQDEDSTGTGQGEDSTGTGQDGDNSVTGQGEGNVLSKQSVSAAAFSSAAGAHSHKNGTEVFAQKLSQNGDGTLQIDGKEWKMDETNGAYVLSEGDYYLENNLTLDVGIMVSGEVTLCLNGNSITCTTTHTVITVGSGTTFTLTDCKETGTITHDGDEQNSNGVTVFDGTFIMEGGSITGNNVGVSGGGGVWLLSGEFNMRGGIITGNTATASSHVGTGNGGGVFVGDGTFNMSGGSITGNTTTGNGGGVFVGDGTFNVSGGVKISGNKNSVGSDSNVYLPNGKTISVTGALGGAEIGVTTATKPGESAPVEIAKGSGYGMKDSDAAVFFADDLGNYCTEFVGGVVQLCEGETLVEHPVCGNTCTHMDKDGNPEHPDVTWKPWSDATSLPYDGYYYLTVDVTLTETWSLSSSTTVALDLNGKTVSINTGNKTIESRGKVTLTDCKGGGKITNKSNSGVGVYVGSGTFDMYSGSISDNTSQEGSGVYVSGGGTFNLYGGSITGNKATDNGGGVYVHGTFNMYGGSISGNRAGTYGGGVYVYGGTFNLCGGSISGNRATGNGGGVFVTNVGEFNMSGGSIADNYSEKYGGGVGMGGGTFNMTGGDIDKNKALYNGGVYVGGGEYASQYGTFTMSGGSISGNNATSGDGNSWGGGVRVDKGIFKMSGGSISGNTATKGSNSGHGGGVYAGQNGTFTMSGTASITDNHARCGGGVYVVGTFNMEGGSITDNKANGGGVYVYKYKNGTFAVSGAVQITGNTWYKSADNVRLSDGKTITVNGLQQGARIGVSTTGKFATGATNMSLNYSEIFTHDTYSSEYDVVRDDEGNLSFAAHQHRWTYEANTAGNTITATCSGCSISGGSVTIQAPTRPTYDGTAKAATLRNSLDSTISVPSIIYAKGGTALNAAPVDAGEYTASITLGGVTATVTFKIAKADAPDAPPSGLTGYVGKALSSVVLPSGWTWVDGEAVMNTAGDAVEFRANYDGDNNHNPASNVAVSVKVVETSGGDSTGGNTGGGSTGGNTGGGSTGGNTGGGSTGGGSGHRVSTSAPAAPAKLPTLLLGSRSSDVKTLQEMLNAKGYNAGSVDGIFGKNTRAAVIAFQNANGLAADGIVGKLTWAKLYDTTAALPSASTATGTQPMVYRGSRGDAVRRLQELLHKKGFDCGAVDGIFGSKTYAAVMAFQKANGLSADGIAGPLTWGKLG